MPQTTAHSATLLHFLQIFSHLLVRDSRIMRKFAPSTAHTLSTPPTWKSEKQEKKTLRPCSPSTRPTSRRRLFHLSMTYQPSKSSANASVVSRPAIRGWLPKTTDALSAMLTPVPYERAAYQWAVETSIYIDQREKQKGIGRLLHDALETALKQQGILNLNACIAYTETEDEHLTLGSVHFHKRLGYQQVAHFHQCGKKFGRWYDMIWMEKLIGEHQ